MEKKRAIRPSLVVVFVCLVLLSAARLVPLPPAGKFHVEGLSSGEGCWQFKDGRVVMWLYPDPESGKSNVTQRVVGSYRKKGDEWFWSEKPGGPEQQIETTLFELRIGFTKGTWAKRAPRWWWP